MLTLKSPLAAAILAAAGWLSVACAKDQAGDQTAKTHAASAATPPSARATAEIPTRHLRAEGQLGPGRGTLVLGLEAPPGSKLTRGAPLRVEAKGRNLDFPDRVSTKLDPKKLPIHLPVQVADGALGPAEVSLSYYWCKNGNEAACVPEKVRLIVELNLHGDAPGGEAFLTYVPLPHQ